MTQAQAFDLLKLGGNVFLTGAPGSGKTYLLNQYIAWLRSQDVSVGVTACTGIAATHLNGKTIHSWAGIGRVNRGASGTNDEEYGSLGLEYSGEYPMRKARVQPRLKPAVLEQIQDAKVLIIDEISMLHPEELDQVNQNCRLARGSFEPFGGLQIVCCGDFFQIPPVKQYGERFVIDSAAWKEATMQSCYLEEQHRQGDPKLLRILDEIRNGTVNQQSLELLKARQGPHAKTPPGIARLYTHRENVQTMNERELAKLAGAPLVYEVYEKGPTRVVAGLKREYDVDRLILKKGARVMFTRNNPGLSYVNGTLGEVSGTNDQGNPVVLTLTGRRIAADREKWSFGENEDGEALATIGQIPLKLAWAITIHKSQGMTLDAAEIDLGEAFARGMGYVALSRVKSLENIYLIGLNKMALEVSERIKKIDKEFREQSEESEGKLERLGPERAARLQADFLNSIRPHSGESDNRSMPDATGELRYETIDDAPYDDIPF